jgi:hypothetical protein
MFLEGCQALKKRHLASRREGEMIDRYTKSVLTVIALALVAIVVQNGVLPARAQLDGPQKVQVCDTLGNCAGMTPVPMMIGQITAHTYALTVATNK